MYREDIGGMSKESRYGVPDGVARQFVYKQHPDDVPQAPIRAREMGVYTILDVYFPAGDGGQNASIIFQGTWKITQASIWNRDAYIPEASSIRLFPAGDTGRTGLPYTTLIDGEAGIWRDLQWQGDLLLDGSWVLRGRTFRSGGADYSAVMHVIAEKLAQGRGL